MLVPPRSHCSKGLGTETGIAAGGRVKASPYAKRLAREAGVDVSQATASGPDGRIVAADVQKLIESGGGKPSEKVAETPSKSTSAATPSGGKSAEVSSEQLFCVLLNAEHVQFFHDSQRSACNKSMYSSKVMPCPSVLCSA